MHPGTLICRMQDADASGTVIDAGRILGAGCRVQGAGPDRMPDADAFTNS